MPAPGLEQLWRGLVRAPFRLKTNAQPFWGRTVLSSGSTTVTVSTTAINSGDLVLAFSEGNAAILPISGETRLASGSATVAVSNALLTTSSQIILQAIKFSVAQASGQGQVPEIISRNAQNFVIGWADGIAPAYGRDVTWIAYGPNGPSMHVEVRSIADGSYFTLGRANNAVVERDTTIHWLIHKRG